MSTGKEICEAWIRRQHPQASEADVARLAREFWDASPRGELFHVFDALAILRAEGWLAPSQEQSPQ